MPSFHGTFKLIFVVRWGVCVHNLFLLNDLKKHCARIDRRNSSSVIRFYVIGNYRLFKNSSLAIVLPFTKTSSLSLEKSMSENTPLVLPLLNTNASEPLKNIFAMI